MSFDSTLPSIRDRIRMIVGDTSGEIETEYFLDETYDATIAEYTNWKIASAVLAEGIAVTIEQDPTSFTATGDMSVGWGDKTRSLREIAARLRREASAEETVVDNTIISVPLTRGGSSSGEYRDDRYARLKR